MAISAVRLSGKLPESPEIWKITNTPGNLREISYVLIGNLGQFQAAAVLATSLNRSNIAHSTITWDQDDLCGHGLYFYALAVGTSAHDAAMVTHLVCQCNNNALTESWGWWVARVAGKRKGKSLNQQLHPGSVV